MLYGAKKNDLVIFFIWYWQVNELIYVKILSLQVYMAYLTVLEAGMKRRIFASTLDRSKR